MFPSVLDNAKVLYYTPPGHYGDLYLTTGEIEDRIVYRAVCQYPDDHKYYLFGCNEEYEVITDWPCDSLQEAMQAAKAPDQEKIIWIQA